MRQNVSKLAFKTKLMFVLNYFLEYLSIIAEKMTKEYLPIFSIEKTLLYLSADFKIINFITIYER